MSIQRRVFGYKWSGYERGKGINEGEGNVSLHIVRYPHALISYNLTPPQSCVVLVERHAKHAKCRKNPSHSLILITNLALRYCVLICSILYVHIYILQTSLVGSSADWFIRYGIVAGAGYLTGRYIGMRRGLELWRHKRYEARCQRIELWMRRGMK